MIANRSRILLIGIALLAGIVAPAPGAVAGDDRDPDADEWEDIVTIDSRGDVVLNWGGTIDLLYMTIGEIYSVGLGETYIFFRVGYNLSEPSDKTVQDTPADPFIEPLQLDVIPDDFPRFISINVTFTVEGDTRRFSIISTDYARTWRSDAGPLVLGKDVEGHDEVLFFSSLRRFGLRAGVVMTDIQVDAYRDDRHTDSMDSFDAVDEYPVPPTILGVLGERELSIPYGINKPKDHVDWVNTQVARTLGRQGPDAESHPLLQTNVSQVAEDPRSGASYQKPHLVKTGKERLTLRMDKEIVLAGRDLIGFINFTTENTMEETTQQMGVMAFPPFFTGWLWNWGPAQPSALQVVPPGERARFQFVAYPAISEAQTIVVVPFIFLSDWGGFERVDVPFIFTDKYTIPLPRGTRTVSEPIQLTATLLNDDGPFRVNEPRELLLQVRDQNGVYQRGMEELRAYVYRFGDPRPDKAHVFTAKPFMDGVYKLPYVFDKPGAWIIEVHFYDLPPNTQGIVPSIDFKVRVQYPRETPDIVPLPLALGGIGLGLVGLAVKERVSKKR